MEVVIDFELPGWLINYYHVVGFFSIFINVLGVYLVIYECSKMDSFRYYLLSFQILCTVTDVHLTRLMQPVTLYPLLAGYSVGVLPTWFGVPTYATMMILMVLIILQLENLVWCFEKKHQSIATILRSHVLHKFFVANFIIVSVICPIMAIVWFNTTRMSKENQWKFIETIQEKKKQSKELQNYPQYLANFQKLEHFDIFEKSLNIMILMLCVLAAGMAVVVFFFLFISDIFRMMHIVKTKISSINYQKHKEALRSLMVQLATSLFCLGPPCVFLGAVFVEVPRAQLVTELAIAWFACHSSVNVISLLIFFPPYQRFIARIFKRTKNKTNIQPPSSFVIV